MKLLIVTQKVDMNDTVLGFFPSWIKRFDDTFGKVSVICLEEGTHRLPEKIPVFSLGKEKQRSRLRYIGNLFFFIWRLRSKYDAVFVHMNEEYVLLGGPLWRLLGKKVVLWRNHTKGTFLTRVAGMLAHKVCYVSPHAFTAQFSNAVAMPAGVDMNHFYMNNEAERERDSFLVVGRISPVKRLEVILEAIEQLSGKPQKFLVRFYGNPTEQDSTYYKNLRKRAQLLEERGLVSFHAGVSYENMPALHQKHEFCINATQTGSFDKTIIESMACGAIPIVSNRSFSKLLPPEFLFEEKNSRDLSRILTNALSFPKERRAFLRKHLNDAARKHSLDNLASKLSVLLGR